MVLEFDTEVNVSISWYARIFFSKLPFAFLLLCHDFLQSVLGLALACWPSYYMTAQKRLWKPIDRSCTRVLSFISKRTRDMASVGLLQTC